MYCTHVRAEIYHLKDEATGKLQADLHVKNAFTKSGFKWKTLSNDPASGKRAQIMQANRPASAIQFEETHRNIESGKEPITIKAGVLMSINPIENKEQKLQQNIEFNTKLISCLVGSLVHYKEQKKITEANFSDANLV